jgi:hypothetical protein
MSYQSNRHSCVPDALGSATAIKKADDQKSTIADMLHHAGPCGRLPALFAGMTD